MTHVESEFTSSVDENLKLRAAAAVRAGIADQLNSGSFPKAALAAADVQMALIYAGAPSRDFGDFIGPDEEAVAEGRVSHSLRTATIGGVHYRVVAVRPTGHGLWWAVDGHMERRSPGSRSCCGR